MANEDVWMACEKHLGKFGAVLNCAPCLQVTLDYVRAALREAREDTRRLDALWDRLQGGPYFVVRLDSADALNRENVERFRGMGIIRLLDADAAMKPPGGEGSGHE